MLISHSLHYLHSTKKTMFVNVKNQKAEFEVSSFLLSLHLTSPLCTRKISQISSHPSFARVDVKHKFSIFGKYPSSFSIQPFLYFFFLQREKRKKRKINNNKNLWKRKLCVILSRFFQTVSAHECTWSDSINRIMFKKCRQIFFGFFNFTSSRDFFFLLSSPFLAVVTRFANCQLWWSLFFMRDLSEGWKNLKRKVP